MSRDDARRAADILEPIGTITVAVDAMNSRGSDDPVTAICLDAITYRIFTIGEATKAMSTTATGAHPCGISVSGITTTGATRRSSSRPSVTR